MHEDGVLEDDVGIAEVYGVPGILAVENPVQDKVLHLEKRRKDFSNQWEETLTLLKNKLIGLLTDEISNYVVVSRASSVKLIHY